MRGKSRYTLQSLKTRFTTGFNVPVTIRKLRWYFHEYDRDDKPSVPHAHSRDGNFKLNPWSGEVYEVINKQLILRGRAKAKELAILQKNEAFIEFAQKEIEWYRRTFPYKSPEMPAHYLVSNGCIDYNEKPRATLGFEINVQFYSLRREQCKYRRHYGHR